MANFTRMNLLKIEPIYQTTVRFRGKINIQRPKPPHFERAKYIQLVQPFFKYKTDTVLEICMKNYKKYDQTNVINKFQQILAKELLDRFQKSRLIVFFHCNPITAEEKYKAYRLFHKEGIEFKNYGKKTMEMALKDTPYENILQFYISHNMIAFSPELKIKEILKITKKCKQLIVLAGILENKFINKDELLKYSEIPSLEVAQTQLVQTINCLGQTLVSQLNAPSNALVLNLNERVKSLENK